MSKTLKIIDPGIDLLDEIENVLIDLDPDIENGYCPNQSQCYCTTK